MKRAHEFEPGQRFGWLTVVERLGTDKHNRSLWLCRCGCGEQTTIDGSHLFTGKTKSCGCAKRLWNYKYAHRFHWEREIYDFMATAEELPDYQTAWVDA